MPEPADWMRREFEAAEAEYAALPETARPVVVPAEDAVPTPPAALDALGEFRHSVWRIVTYTSHDLGGEGTCGYLLSEAQVEEIADEAHEYAKGLVAEALAALAADFDDRVLSSRRCSAVWETAARMTRDAAVRYQETTGAPGAMPETSQSASEGQESAQSREDESATVTNLRNALREAGKEMDRRYEMGAAAERERIWNRPVTQRLELRGGYPGGVWACAGCEAELTEGGIAHQPRCSEMRLADLIGDQP